MTTDTKEPLTECPDCDVKGAEVYRAEAHPTSCRWMMENEHRCLPHDELLRPDEADCPAPEVEEEADDPHNRRGNVLRVGATSTRTTPPASPSRDARHARRPRHAEEVELVSRSEEFHAASNYVGGHKPMPDSPALHEVDKAYPDIYEHPEYYTATWAKRGSPERLSDEQTMRVLHSTRDKPEAPVTMFRAVPHGVRHINTGDWVTSSHAYARQHLESAMEGRGKVISATTQAKHLRSDGDFHHEYGYWGPPTEAK